MAAEALETYTKLEFQERPPPHTHKDESHREDADIKKVGIFYMFSFVCVCVVCFVSEMESYCVPQAKAWDAPGIPGWSQICGNLPASGWDYTHRYESCT